VAVRRAETPAQAREIAEKVDQDVRAAAGLVVRLTQFGVRLAVTPKRELARKFIKAVLQDEEG